MDTNELITLLETADIEFERWKAAHDLAGADGTWGGVNMALSEVKDWQRKRKEADAAEKWLADWEANGKKAGGWLLEMYDGKWYPVELDLDAKWNVSWDDMPNDYFANDTWSHLVVGCTEAENWSSIGDSEDWGGRLGVAWSRDDIKEDPHESGIWGGVVDHESCGRNEGELWRVRHIEFTSRPSQKLREYIIKHPNLRLEFGEV